MSRHQQALREAATAIQECHQLALTCHVGPDGDALGSMLGLAEAATAAGKEAVASYGSPFELSPNLSFLPTDHLVPPAELPAEPELMVVLDAGAADRLGELAPNAEKAKTLVVIDHHITNEGFGDISVVDGSAAATAELVYDLLQLLDWPLTEVVATCLHTALVSDTGRFTYAATSPKTLRIAAELVEAGANPPEIGRHLYEEAPFGYLKAAGAALSRARLDQTRGVVSTFITHEDLDAAGIGWGDIDNLIDILRLATEADVAALAKVHADGTVKVSLRSRGGTDVGGLAASFGGGGHRLAAGFTTEGDPETVLHRVIAAVEAHR
ncbi:MAG: bifunctional oligoribonuclease/PAP phosphatase NrnA [Acidimicrobiia bacterium]